MVITWSRNEEYVRDICGTIIDSVYTGHNVRVVFDSGIVIEKYRDFFTVTSKDKCINERMFLNIDEVFDVLSEEEKKEFIFNLDNIRKI